MGQITRSGHRKSRYGCLRCKSRHVKVSTPMGKVWGARETRRISKRLTQSELGSAMRSATNNSPVATAYGTMSNAAWFRADIHRVYRRFCRRACQRRRRVLQALPRNEEYIFPHVALCVDCASPRLPSLACAVLTGASLNFRGLIGV
jgi:hypothetical protein